VGVRECVCESVCVRECVCESVCVCECVCVCVCVIERESVCVTFKIGKSRCVRWTGYINRTRNKSIQDMHTSSRDVIQISERKGDQGETNFRHNLQEELSTTGFSRDFLTFYQ
jgi:hypothetical protein